MKCPNPNCDGELRTWYSHDWKCGLMCRKCPFEFILDLGEYRHGKVDELDKYIGPLIADSFTSYCSEKSVDWSVWEREKWGEYLDDRDMANANYWVRRGYLGPMAVVTNDRKDGGDDRDETQERESV